MSGMAIATDIETDRRSQIGDIGESLVENPIGDKRRGFREDGRPHGRSRLSTP